MGIEHLTVERIKKNPEDATCLLKSIITILTQDASTQNNEQYERTYRTLVDRGLKSGHEVFQSYANWYDGYFLNGCGIKKYTTHPVALLR